MASRPQQKPQTEPNQPGLKVVEKPAESSAPRGQDSPRAGEGSESKQGRHSEAAAQRRLHPHRVWPD
jgi:hypothetical protein